MNFPSQDSYDVVKNGRFIGRISVQLYPGQETVQFHMQQTFEEWRRIQDGFPMKELEVYYADENILELRLVKFVFTDGSCTRIFDASGIPVELLNRVKVFQPAY